MPVFRATRCCCCGFFGCLLLILTLSCLFACLLLCFFPFDSLNPINSGKVQDQTIWDQVIYKTIDNSVHDINYLGNA